MNNITSRKQELVKISTRPRRIKYQITRESNEKKIKIYKKKKLTLGASNFILAFPFTNVADI